MDMLSVSFGSSYSLQAPQLEIGFTDFLPIAGPIHGALMAMNAATAADLRGDTIGAAINMGLFALNGGMLGVELVTLGSGGLLTTGARTALHGGMLLADGGANGARALVTEAGAAAREGGSYFRGARPGALPDFTPRPNEFKVDSATGLVRDSHGVSVFNNPGSVSSKGFVPHEVDQATIPESLRIIQRGSDPAHFEITPQPGANLTPQQFVSACKGILCL